MNQLDSLWAMSGEKERLIERTRIRRPTGADKKIALDPQQNQDIFDDRDFYHSLLKEVVNTNMRETGMSSFTPPPSPSPPSSRWVFLVLGVMKTLTFSCFIFHKMPICFLPIVLNVPIEQV